MTQQKIRFSWFVALLAVATGCPQCAPDRVGPGVAQLTIRNVGSMVSLVNSNAVCGFASPAVLSSPVVEGNVGSAGVLTFTVNQCVIDLGTLGVANPADCNGNSSTARGKFTISATRRIEGTLTGNPQSPIIPSSPDAVTITVTNATFENFEARSENSGNFLIMKSGSLSAVVKPRLAASASSGACAVSTPNVTFSDIVYTDAQLHLTTPDNSFDVPVPTSNISAQNGVNGGQENTLVGTVTVFESPVTLNGDLDPDYDAARFVSGYSCHPDLPTPISYQCADLNALLADGAARLSAKMQGTITSLIDANNTCGFSSSGVLSAGVIQDPAGGAPTPGEDGVLTLTVTNCELSFPAGTVLPAGCSGSSTVVGGKVTVSGTKVVSGRFTANSASPIVPATEQPATISLTSVIGAEGFKVGSTADVNALEATAGTLVGTTRPRVFVGAATGVCSVSSPHADLTMAWSDADMIITSTTGTLALDAVSTDLEATNGKVGANENALSGTVTVAGTAYTVNVSGAGLDPAFNLATFESGWQCGSTLEALTSTPNSQCGVALMTTVGGGSAALTMRTLGTVTSLVDANSTCGFSSGAVATTPSFSTGSVGDDDVTATFTLGGSGCTITVPADTVVSTNCLGQTTSVGGTVVVTGTKAVTGFRTGSSNPAEFIVPSSFKPAEFNLTLTFTDFVVKSSASTAFLTVHSGSLAGTVQPRTALAPATGVCSIATPNVTFSNVVWTNGETTLNSAGSLFNASLSTSALAAQNGTDGETTNSLSGSLTLDMVPLTGIQAPLDRAYDQAIFDSTYACASGSPVLVPDAACSFRQVLGGAAARLLAGSVAVATGASTNPSFSCYPPETITGTIGQPGSSTTAASSCAVALPADTTLSTECPATGGVSKGGGSFSISGTKNTNPGLVLDMNTDGTADTIAPLRQNAVTYDSMSYAMNGWSFEKLLGTTSTGKITLTGTVGVEKFTPVLAQADENNDDVGDGVFTKRTPIFEVAGLTLPSGTAQLLLQGKRFNVGLTNVDLDMVVGAYAGLSNSIGGSLVVDGEAVAVTAGSPFQTAPPFTQGGLDAAYSCDPTLILVPAN